MCVCVYVCTQGLSYTINPNLNFSQSLLCSGYDTTKMYPGVFANGPGFNPRSSHTKNLKNCT